MGASVLDEVFNYHANSSIGRVIYNRRGVKRLILPGQGKVVGERVAFPKSSHSPRFVAALKRSLKNYFAGVEVNFSSVQVDLTGFSVFEREVYHATRMIPYGERRSYKWIAEKIGRPRSFRAVGKALGKNQALIIIPCHRVVKKSGTLGGWNGPLGWKKKLLMLEVSRGEGK